jgi:hypothetical protein
MMYVCAACAAVCCLLLQYCNIEALVKELGIPSPFTPFTSSSFWTPDGLQVSTAQHSTAWHSMAQHGMAWHVTAQHGMSQHEGSPHD